MYLEDDDEPAGHAVLRINGMIKVGETVRDFERSLDHAITQRTGAVILDLTDLEYMDSTTIGVLVGALHRLKSENRDLVLVNPRERIASLLRVARLDSLFEIHSTVEEARAALDRRQADTGVN